MTTHDHVLITELLSNILRSTTADLNPDSGEEGTSSQNKGEVEDGVERIQHQLSYSARRRNVVGESGYRIKLSRVAFNFLPGTNKLDNRVGRETSVYKLADEIELGNKSSLEDDGDVASVEELDGICSSSASLVLVLDRKVNTESLYY